MTTETQTLRTRYPGTRPFTKDDEEVFFGRDEDITTLATYISVEKTIVLYGKSGLGKSSILNAGVLPKLEKEYQYVILPIRFGSYAQGGFKHALDVAEEKFSSLSNQSSFLNKIESEDISLWQHLKNLELAIPSRSTFLLVLDQFEELFTYPEGVGDFAEALADLLYHRMPKNFQRALRLATQYDPHLLTPEQMEFLQRPVNLKVLMSIRSDRMSLLDRLSSAIPSILQNCYELKPLSRAQAELAITEPTQKEGKFQSSIFSYQPDALEKILDYLTQAGTRSIESFQLGILCRYVEENIVIAQNDNYVEEKDLGDLEAVYQNYYDLSLEKVGTNEEQQRARVLIEEGLIFEKEQRRIPLYEGQLQSVFHISPDLLRRLVDTHIIRAEPHGSGGFLYEISHDTLVAPILSAKARRYENEKERQLQQQALEKRKRYKKRTIRAVTPPLLALFVFASLVIKYGRGSSGNFDLDVVYILALIFTILLFIGFGAFCTLAFIYEFIFGESILSKLRKRAEDPTKQKGLLTKLSRWLS